MTSFLSFTKYFFSLNKEILVFSDLTNSFSYDSTITIISLVGLCIANPKIFFIFLANLITLLLATFHFLKSASVSLSDIFLFQSIL